MHYLECEEFDKTEKIGHQLVQGHYTGGFEILGRLALGMGDYAEAISWLKRGPDEAPEIPNFWSYLGQCYSDTGEYDLAEHAFWRYCDLQTDEPAGHLNLAVVYGRKGEPAAGLEALTAQLLGMTLGDDESVRPERGYFTIPLVPMNLRPWRLNFKAKGYLQLQLSLFMVGYSSSAASANLLAGLPSRRLNETKPVWRLAS